MLLLIPELLTQESLAVVAAFGEDRVVGVPAVSDLTCADVLSMAGAESVVGVWGGGGGVAALGQLLEGIGQWCDQLASGELDAAVIFAVDGVPSVLQARVPAALRPWLQWWGAADLLLIARERLLQDSGGGLSAVVAGGRLVGTAVRHAVGESRAEKLAAVTPGAVPCSGLFSVGQLQRAIDLVIGECGLRGAAAKCFAAGLLLYWDHADESHQISQTMEGRGNPRTADYWHGIMHRREPDPGNAGWWFRRVGEHPVLQQVGGSLLGWLRELGAGAGVIARAGRLVSGGRLDPIRLIELSTEVRRSGGAVGGMSEAEQTLRLVQHLEMLQLLLWELPG